MDAELAQIQEHCNFGEFPRFVRHLHGGDINAVFLISADDQNWVVKRNKSKKFPEMLAKEFRAMHYLGKTSPLRHPKMLHHFSTESQQFLVMEYIEEAGNTKKGQENLGKGLAQQHLISKDDFGWQEDNYIGSLVQVNNKSKDWNSFFAEHRLLHQSQQVYDKGLFSRADVQKMERLCNRLDDIIPVEKPALLHGDLWGGNYFISNNDEPILYDPAVYFGHREMDMAMTHLFGGFSEVFYRSYQVENPLEQSWESRIGLFQLYPNLVHLNLFGRAYLNSIQRVIEKH